MALSKAALNPGIEAYHERSIKTTKKALMHGLGIIKLIILKKKKEKRDSNNIGSVRDVFFSQNVLLL